MIVPECKYEPGNTLIFNDSTCLSGQAGFITGIRYPFNRFLYDCILNGSGNTYTAIDLDIDVERTDIINKISHY